MVSRRGFFKRSAVLSAGAAIVGASALVSPLTPTTAHAELLEQRAKSPVRLVRPGDMASAKLMNDVIVRTNLAMAVLADLHKQRLISYADFEKMAYGDRS